jgi:hypothetical protein
MSYGNADAGLSLISAPRPTGAALMRDLEPQPRHRPGEVRQAIWTYPPCRDTTSRCIGPVRLPVREKLRALRSPPRSLAQPGASPLLRHFRAGALAHERTSRLSTLTPFHPLALRRRYPHA